MRMNVKTVSSLILILFFLFLFLGNASQDIYAQKPDKVGKITITLTNFRNDSGVVRVALCNSKDTFTLEGDKAFKKTQSEIKNKQAVVTFEDVPYGDYAIVAFHDENMSGKLEKGALGKPLKGYGLSNNPKKRVRQPTFDESKFTLNVEALNLEIKMIYR